MSIKLLHSVIIFLIAYLVERLLDIYTLSISPEILVILLVIAGVVVFSFGKNPGANEEERIGNQRNAILVDFKGLRARLKYHLNEVKEHQNFLLRMIEGDKNLYEEQLNELAYVKGKIKDMLQSIDDKESRIARFNKAELDVVQEGLSIAQNKDLSEIRRKIGEVDFFIDKHPRLVKARLNLADDAAQSSVRGQAARGKIDASNVPNASQS